MNRRRLPIGIQHFRRIRERDCYYVDKTPLIRELTDRGDNYFLSRPRRFGKSLLLDTLHELFAGSEALFRGLAIHGHWDWDDAHPVVHLSFGGKYIAAGDLEADILTQLLIIEEDAGLGPAPGAMDGPDRLRYLLHRLRGRTGKPAVVLVDEYDKPILDALDNPELAKSNRDYLRGFYGVIKDSARLVRFVFVTGVSMFSKVSLFSGLNNLKDISLDPRYATLAGYTDGDLDTVFAPELPGLDRDEIRHWYNGYHWRGDEKVYNPFDMLLLFDNREFQPHWFETGTPDFLYRLLLERGEDPLDLERRPVSADRLSRFDVGDIDLRALMFQAGYLTIASEERVGPQTLFTLEFPNREVRHSFSAGLLAHLGRERSDDIKRTHGLLDALAANDFKGFANRLGAHLAGIPHQWRDAGGDLGRYESHHAAMLYMSFCSAGADVRVEDASSRGRADMVLLHGGQVFVLEIKPMERGEDAESALERAIGQIRERGYGDKYRGRGEPVHLLGVVFDRAGREPPAVRAVHHGVTGAAWTE